MRTAAALAVTALPLPALAAGAAPSAPVLGTGTLLQVAVALALVLALVAGAAWALRRVGGATAGGSGAVRVLGGVALGTRERAVLVQVGETQLLLGVAPGRVQTLHVLERPVAVAAPGGGAFAGRLAAALRRGAPAREDG